MKKNLFVIVGVLVVLAVFLFIAWKQGIWTLPGEKLPVKSNGSSSNSVSDKCWSEGKWYNDRDNYVKDEGCTVCICNGKIHTINCVPNTLRADCVAKAVQP